LLPFHTKISVSIALDQMVTVQAAARDLMSFRRQRDLPLLAHPDQAIRLSRLIAMVTAGAETRSQRVSVAAITVSPPIPLGDGLEVVLFGNG